MEFLDILAIVLNLMIFTAYHIYFFYQSFLLVSSKTLSGWQQSVRSRWVQQTSLKKGGDILAVQTLRNWIIAATFFATVSITISFGLLSFIVQTARLSDNTGIDKSSFVYSILTSPLTTLKTEFILACNFIAFFCFSQSVRYFNHTGFALGVPYDVENDDGGLYETHEHVATLLNTGSRFFTTGIRFTYLSIPYVFWYFGPVAFMVSSAVLIVTLVAGDNSLPGKFKRDDGVLRLVQVRQHF